MSKRAIILGAFALVAAATAFAFLREPDPQAVLRQATKKALAEKTFRLEMRGTVVGLPKSLEGDVVSGATGVDMNASMEFDRSDPLRPASASTFDLVQGLSSGGQAKLAGEARRKDGTHYVRLSELEGVQGLETKRVVGTWMKSKEPFISLLLGSGAAEPPLDAAETEALKARASTIDLFTVVKKLPKETVGGSKSLHYAVELNMEVVSALLLKNREMRFDRELASEDVLAVTGELLQWNRPVGEIWIDARTRKIKQLTLGTALGQEGKGGAAAVTIVFSNEGKPVRVDVPEAEDVEDVLGPLFEKRLSLSGSRAVPLAPSAEGKKTGADTALLPGVDAQVADADGDGLSDAQEAFYGVDAWNPDTDGDGYTDGLEVDKGMNPLGPGPLFGFGL